MTLIYLTQVLSISSDHPWDGSTPSLSPAVFVYTDWTWLGKPHTCLCKTLQLTVHVRANENREVKGTAWRAQRQNCGKAQIWPRLQKNSAALKVPKSTVASIILKWKTFGTTRTLLELAVRPKLSYRGRRALVREVKKNPKITVAELQRCIREMGESCRSQPSLQPSTSRGCMAEWPDGRPLLSARHMKACMELLKNTWRTPRWWQIRFSGLMRPRYNFLALILSGMCGENQALLITCPIQSQQWSMVVAASCCGGVFQLQGQDDWLQSRERWMRPSTGISWLKTFSRVLGTSDWAEGYLPTRQWP